jgi:phosphoserine phosphatase RsbU/P
MRRFWERVTEGFELEQLWGQFLTEARASYGLYSQDVDWTAIGRETKIWKRPFLVSWALFQAMLMKLAPARRVLFLLALVLLIFQFHVHIWSPTRAVNLGWFGTAILFLLLALELADRVTMKRDLEIAREIQQWLVPAHPPQISGVDIAFATRPQNTIAGDYYDAFLRPSPNASGICPLLIAVADVAGKSVPAALLMATFQASLRALSATPATLEETVVGLDRYARAHSLGGRRFTSAFLAEIDPLKREMRFINAGHNAPILLRATGDVERLSAVGPPLGLPVFDGTETLYCAKSIQLHLGDLLFVFTDGVVEAVDQDDQDFGEERLLSCLRGAARNPAAEVLKKVMAEVGAFVGYARQHDDITCLVFRIGDASPREVSASASHATAIPS